MLKADGGHSGKTSNYSDYCGDGGGGGVIDVMSLDYSISAPNFMSVHGGRGLENGQPGKRRIRMYKISLIVLLL